MTIQEARQAQKEIGETLIFMLFKCISNDYKKKYARDIWTQFENTLRQSAYTSSFSIFIEKFCNKIPNDYYQNSELMAVVVGLPERYEERKILEWIRGATTFMVTAARAKNDGLKYEYEQSQVEKKEQKKATVKQEPKNNPFSIFEEQQG